MTVETKQKPGCLTSLLSFFRRSKITAPETLPYRLRDDFLSPAEFSFYKVLASLVGSRLTILPKVRLADIFFVARPNENVSYFNRISQRHVDFLLCKPSTMKPVVGIELDDTSHNQPSRQLRDEFIDKVFLVAGLPLLHMPVQRDYNSQEISTRLAQLFKTSTNTSTSPAINIAAQPYTNARQVISAPLCPKCGIPMVVRIASQGEYKGQQFFGCQNYPRCREVKPISGGS
jgi:hypothetical protein